VKPAGPQKLSQRIERAQQANELLDTIAHSGRRFFYHLTRVSRFEVDGYGRVWWLDKYRNERQFTHYSGRWRNFSQGGTLREVVERLRDYIMHGTPVPANRFGPWPDSYCNGDLWGYGDDMEKVRSKARELGIVSP
jgi:hypothetical protein